ncbi:UDP-N-acetylmuramoyl-tripeptide--D-alanyl-D-alanine ligase [uncultured Paludibacter sp.]|uniref:UDP-N-acetylmuramoyl-tripeptide--D-alanyl-D-alanine ligase n=1 Tax=uncultured Paludibacter sp. TaxID=497635 RepID=A0A653ACS9_9BACT|nr:UDP-N-acetylmuramoyl-tripeptide--D-alanyl-D-alanine ligase [uncultured Paludibacter sp.]
MKLYEIFQKHPVISTDSRNCPEGCTFFALKGENFNANAFALSALEKGASFAVVDEKEYAVDERFILVENVLETLQSLARYHRRQLKTTIIGITGTNGKTTTKELIASVLKEKYNTHFTQGNLNNHIGVPLTLLQLKPEHEMAVIEMGANHPGEIKLLSEIALPDYGIITNVGKAHLEGFGSFEGVMKTKAELYDYIFAEGEKIFLNTGNDYLVSMAKKSGFKTEDKIIAYKILSNFETLTKLASEQATGRILSCSPLLKLECSVKNETFDIQTNLIGTYNAENVLAAAAIGNYFGVDNQLIKNALEKYTPRNNRSQLTVTENNKLVVDAYNANPTSMRAAILNFSQMEVKDKTLILGDMLELGEQSAEEHQKIVDLLKENQLSDVILVGKDFKNTKNTFTCYDSVEDLKEILQKKPIKNRFILVKGSHGIHLEKLIENL